MAFDTQHMMIGSFLAYDGCGAPVVLRVVGTVGQRKKFVYGCCIQVGGKQSGCWKATIPLFTVVVLWP